MSWDDIVEVAWEVPPAARPRYALGGNGLVSEKAYDPDAILRHPERELRVGTLSVAEDAVPEWLADGPDWLTGGAWLLFEFDTDWAVAGVEFPYGTKYEAPSIASLPLDPAVDGWVPMPAGAYQVLEVGRVARLWHWGDIDKENAPPDGAGMVTTRQQPNATDVPIRYVPAAALPADTSAGDVLTPPTGDEPLGLGSYRRDEDAAERVTELRADIVQSYAETACGGVEPSWKPESLVVDYSLDSVSYRFEGLDYLAVSKRTDDEVFLRELSVSRPDRAMPLDGEKRSSGYVTVDDGSIPAFEIDPVEQSVVIGTADGDAFIKNWPERARFRAVRETVPFERGDVFQVSDAPRPDGEPQEGARALAYDPGMTALFRHQLPEFRTGPYELRPEHVAESFPLEQRAEIARTDSDFDPYWCECIPVDGDRGQKTDTSYEQLPPSADAIALRYELDPESVDPTPRYTRAWPDRGE